jgi:hypothetical protein
MSWADSPGHIHAVDFADVADGGVRCCIGRGVQADHFLSDGEAEVESWGDAIEK